MEIPAKSSVEVELLWNPTEKGTFSESIHVKDSKGRRGIISLALSAVPKFQPKVKLKNNSFKKYYIWKFIGFLITKLNLTGCKENT